MTNARARGPGGAGAAWVGRGIVEGDNCTPSPRNLPWSKVEQATGSGDSVNVRARDRASAALLAFWPEMQYYVNGGPGQRVLSRLAAPSRLVAVALGCPRVARLGARLGSLPVESTAERCPRALVDRARSCATIRRCVLDVGELATNSALRHVTMTSCLGVAAGLARRSLNQ